MNLIESVAEHPWAAVAVGFWCFITACLVLMTL
jgi:hypothetical protein